MVGGQEDLNSIGERRESGRQSQVIHCHEGDDRREKMQRGGQMDIGVK